jgi:hypothetical protein
LGADFLAAGFDGLGLACTAAFTGFVGAGFAAGFGCGFVAGFTAALAGGFGPAFATGLGIALEIAGFEVTGATGRAGADAELVFAGTGLEAAGSGLATVFCAATGAAGFA